MKPWYNRLHAMNDPSTRFCLNQGAAVIVAVVDA